MSEDAVKDNITMCEGCLAADRTLTKLGKHTYLFNKLVASVGPDVEPLMCWECISVFNKIYKFQQQVSKAQFTLKYKHEFEPEYECLSSLNKLNRIDYYDLEIEHKENNIYKCAVVKLENIDQLVDHYLNCNLDNNSNRDGKNDCNADAAFFDTNEKHAVTNKDNKDDANDINYDDNDCKSEINDGDQSCYDFGDNNDIENKEVDSNNDCKSEINNGDQSCYNFGDNDVVENNATDNINDCKSEINDNDQTFADFGNDNDIENTEIDSGGSLETKSKKKRKPRKQIYFRYKVVEGLKDRDKLYKTLKVDKQELLDHMEKERNTNIDSRFKINCALCLSKFSTEEYLRKHEENCHSPTNKWICDICKQTFPTQSKLKLHSYKHSKYVCSPCGHVTYTRSLMYMHLTYYHKKLWECVECQIRFPSSQRLEFHKHYRDMHMTFICDYCGEKFSTKSLIEYHMRKMHIKLICEKCNITFTRYLHMINHKKLKHMAPEPSEETYCVECNIQFPNKLKYKRHLLSSTKHRPRKRERAQCPECKKVYARKSFMKKHYNYFHLKKLDYLCEICSKSFLTAHKLRSHIDITHLKIPQAKNKLCPHCGRGFSATRTLTHHIRTHTGERPFSCEHCPAAFAQKTALKTHVQSKHKETLTQSNVRHKLMNK